MPLRQNESADVWPNADIQTPDSANIDELRTY